MRITSVILCYALGWAAVSVQIAPATVPWRAKIADPGRLLGVVVRPASQLSAELVEEIGRMTLFHAGYDWWWRNSQSVTRHPVGQVTALGRNAVAEFRDTDGTVTRKVLAGSDPLSIETANGHFRLLHFSFHPVPLAREKGWLVRGRLDVSRKPISRLTRCPENSCCRWCSGPSLAAR